MNNNNELFRKGLKDGLAIGLSYIPAAMAISVSAAKQNFPFAIWELMSALIYSSSSQAAVLNLFSNGTTTLFIYILTFSVITFRHVLLSLSLSQKLDSSVGTFCRMLFAPFNSDEIYSIIMQQNQKVKTPYLLGISIVPYMGQMIGVNAGFLFTQALPASLKSAMGMTIYAVFLALIIPPVKKSSRILAAVVFSGLISWILECIPVIKSGLPAGTPMIICTLLTCLLGALFMPIHTEDENLEGNLKKNNI